MAITVLGNISNLANVANTGKYEILKLFLLFNILSCFFKSRLTAHSCYPFNANKAMQRTHQKTLGCFKGNTSNFKRKLPFKFQFIKLM